MLEILKRFCIFKLYLDYEDKQKNLDENILKNFTEKLDSSA